jgi:hypothetical protein
MSRAAAATMLVAALLGGCALRNKARHQHGRRSARRARSNADAAAISL